MKIGVLGGGQLARMLSLAGYPLGIELICIDPSPDCSAQQVTTVIQADFYEIEIIKQHFHDVHCVTYETESLPIDAIQALSIDYKFMPTIEALRIAQDRLYEKDFLRELAIPTTTYQAIDSWDDLRTASNNCDYPLILKTRCNGYDGKGQFVISTYEEAVQLRKLADGGGLIIEKWIAYQFELSLVFARSHTGDIVFYPLTLNKHQQGILRLSEAPYVNDKLQTVAEQYAVLIAEKLHYVGVMAIEFFYVDGHLMVNEIAPRVHNSGHWTIEGAVTSQFENHLRAITGLPLGATAAQGLSTMINCISNEPSNLTKLLSMPDIHMHTYGKKPRANRKLGHITICAQDQQEMHNKVLFAESYML